MSYRIQDAYGSIFEKKLMDELLEVATIKEFKEEDTLIEIGEYLKRMPLLLQGVLKIKREDPDHGELLLYFIEKGDTCALTLQCCIGDVKSTVRAVAETDGIVAMVPISKMEQWMEKYPSWRNFVMNSYNNRLLEMLTAIDNLAFLNMEKRLWNYLQEKAKINQNNTVNNTHQEIAYDLNTSRVVVSRLLKNLEREGVILLNRKNIELL